MYGRQRAAVETRQIPGAQQAIARVFDQVLREYGITHAAVARIWQCTEGLVRGVRAGERALPLAKVLVLPDDVAEAVLRGVTSLLSPAHEPDGQSFHRAVADVAIAYGRLLEAEQAHDGESCFRASELTTAAARVERCIATRKGSAT